MSGDSLLRTGANLAVTLGGVAGLGQLSLPLPLMMAVTAAVMIIIGAVLIRLSFRRGRSAAHR
ncbi:MULTISPECIES: hypothetical protein [unclassified Solwaraspora]|uniref:hypothetical protein n=1 Tax=unclassified Solwaraspora TaxID=2627926 RepID=UPI00248BB987|nr:MULTISPECIES: hypothetical protein [unclassified Solwaraspora]WBB96593.1 hypothetical protein O7553_25375 [Solwaraspora sp. WMMA2059]WJK32914.1 hypothetical protein O7610_19565 [Solwaraspora sp. WMMA2065]